MEKVTDGITNRYGQFTDSPVEKRWVFNFRVLFIPLAHRRILNREPKVTDDTRLVSDCVRELAETNDIKITFLLLLVNWIVDWKALNN